MKRRVQAQRKFAQSVALPAPAQPPPEPPPPAVAAPARTRECRVIHNKMSASNLLDVVSYHNIHKHKGPVVVLTRLGSKAPVKPPTVPTKIIVKNKATFNAKIGRRNTTMRLRSRNIINRKIVKAKNKLRPKKQPVPARRITRSRTLDTSSSLALSDDERPLKYFKSQMNGSNEPVVRVAAFKQPAAPNSRKQYPVPIPRPKRSTLEKPPHLDPDVIAIVPSDVLELDTDIEDLKSEMDSEHGEEAPLRAESTNRDDVSSVRAESSHSRASSVNHLGNTTPELRAESSHSRVSSVNLLGNAPPELLRGPSRISIRRATVTLEHCPDIGMNRAPNTPVTPQEDQQTESKRLPVNKTPNIKHLKQFLPRQSTTASRFRQTLRRGSLTVTVAPCLIPEVNSAPHTPVTRQEDQLSENAILPLDEPIHKNLKQILPKHSTTASRFKQTSRHPPKANEKRKFGMSPTLAREVNVPLRRAKLGRACNGDQGINTYTNGLSRTPSPMGTSEETSAENTSRKETVIPGRPLRSSKALPGDPTDTAVPGPSGLQGRGAWSQRAPVPRSPPPPSVVTLSDDDEECAETFPASRVPRAIPRAPSPSAASDSDDEVRSRCPSRLLPSVGSVFTVINKNVHGRCNNCVNCLRVDKVNRLCQHLLASKQLGGAEEAGDVYRFAEPEHPVQPYQPLKRPPPPPSVASSTADGENRLYFDIFPPESPQIIELTTFKVPNTNKRMMKARLIPRSEAQTANMPLVEHEILLEELLQMAPQDNAQEQHETEAVENGNEARSHKLLTRRKSLRTQLATQPKIVIEPATVPPKDKNEAVPPPPGNQAKNKGIGKKSSPKVSSSGPAPKAPGPQKTSSSSGPQPLPKTVDGAKLVDAPTFYPTEKEFNDPITYIEKVTPLAAKYGVCKIVAPKDFKPECYLDDTIMFNVSNQYIARLYSRWGSGAREMAAIKACLSSLGVKFRRPPLMAGVELSLPKLYAVVQKCGGFNEVNEKKRWGRVAEEMGLAKLNNPEKKLDSMYVKYLVPYETLSHQERQQIMNAVEKAWLTRNAKLLEWAFNPLQRQKRLLGDAESSESEPEEDEAVAEALAEAEDCVAKGRKMKLGVFKNVAQAAEDAFLPKKDATVQEIENEYWRLVLLGTEHVCVNSASIDTGDHGYGFSKGKASACAKHPWNLKMLSANSGNVLRSLGAVLGVTVPTLHLGMVYSTSCWHRDPHGLPWIEYMHQGPSKIWYGIANEQSANFRRAVESLCPTSCQNKSIWLPSDITMIPPNLLREHNVSLSRLVQNPGEFIVVFPKAYSCSICTGFTISESVYFATNSWLNTVHQVFQELAESCEPTTFSLVQLLISIATDPRAPLSVLPLTYASLSTVVRDEQRNRRDLRALHLPYTADHGRRRQSGAWNVREQAECDICRATLYLSKVTGITGRQSAVCLAHTLQMIQDKRGQTDLTQLLLVEFFSDQELDHILEGMQNKLT